MSNPLQVSFWDDEFWMMYNELSPAALTILFSGAKAGAEALPKGLQVLVNWDWFNQEAVRWLDTWAADSAALKGIHGHTRTQAVRAIQDWVRSGAKLDVLKARLTPLFGKERAERIAVTEVTRMYAEGNLMAWKSTGFVTEKKWQTAMDERVCFPAWTLIDTPGGKRPIQAIKSGDLVISASGPRRVIANSARKYTGRMIGLFTRQGWLFATEDHPLWEFKQGWLNASDFYVGNFGKQLNNQPIDIKRRIDFTLCNSNDRPSVSSEVIRFALISLGVSVPVSAIDFKSNANVRNEKINTIAPHLGLLDKFNARCFQGMADRFLQKGFDITAAIAGKRAKLSISIQGLPSKFLSASRANNHNRRAATILGAIMPIQTLFSPEKFTTSFAGNIFGGGRATRPATDLISTLRRPRNDINFPANRTGFSNCNCSPERFIAFMSTELLASLGPGFISVESLATLQTSQFNPSTCGGMITSRGTKDSFISSLLRPQKWFITVIADILKRHGVQFLCKLSILYHILCGKTTVYNLQIEDDPTYYANGLLVHNCPICGPLHGKTVAIESNGFTTEIGGIGLTAPPAHARCRCWLLPVVTEGGLEQALLRGLTR